MSPALPQQALASAFDWTWKTSLEATVLIVLVLLFQFTFAKILSPRWRYGLGLLILLRLVLPAAPASPLSIFNLGNHHPQQAEIDTAPPAIHPFVPPVFLAAPAADISASLPVQPIPTPPAIKISAREILPWLWLAGFAFMLGRVTWQQRRFVRTLGRWKPVCEPRVLGLVESCRAQLGVGRNVAVLAATGLNTPALFGVIKPRLLLPVEMVHRLDERELRHVLLHELVHLQRGDLLVNWAMIVLRATHWFNPAVWFAFHRLRAEQELACDAAVMARLAPNDRRDYGRTLLKLLDDFSPGALCPGYVPFITSKQIIKRRITMISNFQPAGRLAAGASIALLIALGSMTFTRADETNGSADQKDAASSSSGDQSRNTTIQTSDGSVTVTFSKDGTAKVGTNMTLRAPAAVTVGRDGMMRVTAEKVQMDMPRTPSYQYNGFTYSTGDAPLRFNLLKDGSIHAGKDGPAMDAAALQKYVEDHVKTGGKVNMLVTAEDGDVNVATQLENIFDALKGRPLGTFNLRHGKDVEVQMAEINASVAQAMTQAQAQMQRTQANLATQQAAIQAYGRALAVQPGANIPQVADTDRLAATAQNQFRNANELAAENIRLTEAKLNDLRNLKETYASDATEHSSDQRELTSKLNDMLVEAETQCAGKEALLRQLEQLSHADQRQALPTTVPDATLDKLIQDELAAETKLTELSSTRGDSNPEVQATRKVIDKLNSQIDARVKGILDGLRAQVRAANDSIQTLQKQLDDKSRRQTELTDLASQIDKTENELRDLKSQLSGIQDYQGREPQAVPPTK